MAISIAVANIKGGIGKTSTIINLYDQLKKRGFRVLMIDMDPQRNTTAVFRAKIQDTATMADILLSGFKAKDCIQHTEFGDIIANDGILIHADTQVPQGPGMYKILKKALKPIEKDYDYILLDNPPHMGVLLGNTLMYTQYVIIPIEFDLFGVQSLEDLSERIEEYKEDNPDLTVLGIVKVKYKPRQNLTRSLEENSLPEYAKQMHTTMFETSIRESVRVKEAITLRERLTEYAPKAPVTEDFSAFTDEVQKRIAKNEKRRKK